MSYFVPVTELHRDADHPYDINWQFNLPPNVEADSVMVNINRLNTLHRIGGIAASFVYDYQGEVSQFTPGVSGINPDGSAIASKIGITTPAETKQSKSIDLYPQLSAQYKKTLGVHGINKAEAASLVSDKILSGASRETAWAKVLDKSIRDSIVEVGQANLIQQGGTFSRTMDGIVTANHLYVLAKMATNQEYATSSSPVFIASLYALIVGFQSLENKFKTGETLLRDRRWAFGFGDNQIDRYALLKTVASAPGLIKSRP